jgi:hypothetical protein
MAVPVVRPDRHQSDAGSRRSQKAAVGVAAAVVRHLEDVGPQVRTRRHDPRLGLRTEVAGEQHTHPVLGHPDDQGQVVGRGTGHRPPRLRREHLHGGGSHGVPLSGEEHLVDRARSADQRPDRCRALVVGGQRPGADHVDGPAVEHPGEPAGVVGVQVREQDQGQVVDVQPIQAPVHRRGIRPGVHEHSAARAHRDHQRVALADVAGDEHRAVRRPTAHHLAQRPADRRQPHRGGQRQPPGAAGPPQQHRGAQQPDRQEHGAPDPDRPRSHAVRDGGRALGQDDQPAHRPAGQPDHGVGRPRCHHGQDGGDQAEDRRRRDGGCREQVGGHRHQADHPGQGGDDRRGRDSGRGAHRDRLGDDRWASSGAQGTSPAGREQHDRPGRDHRQRETRITGQRRLAQDEHGHRGAQGRQRRPGPPGGQCEQRDRTHHRRPQHARLRAGEHHEAGQHEDADHRLHPPVHRTAAQRPEDAREQDGHVGTGHRRQVGEPGPPELLLQHRVHGRGVPHDEAGEQAGGAGLQHPVRRAGQPVPDGARGFVQPAGAGQDLRRSARGQHRDDGAVPRRSHAHPYAHGLTGPHTGPLVRRREHQHVVPQDVRASVVVQADHRRPHEEPGPGAVGQHPGWCVDGQPHGDGAPVSGGERRRLARDAADRRGAGGDGGGREQRQQQSAAPGHPAPDDEGGDRSPHRERGGRGNGQPGQGDAPDHGRHREQSQVDPAPAVGARGPAGDRRRRPHTVTRSARPVKIAGPIPLTSFSSSTLANRPARDRWSTMR